jgi:hypothetical protein
MYSAAVNYGLRGTSPITETLFNFVILAAAAEEVDRHVRIVTFVAPAIVSE